jgi:transcriptional regulator with XRE-family HTH domain
MLDQTSPVTTPAERIQVLRARYGSHDKLAAALGTSRQRVIAWQKGAQPSVHYREKLASLDGGDPDDYLNPTSEPPPDKFTRLADAVEENNQLLRELLEALSR